MGILLYLVAVVLLAILIIPFMVYAIISIRNFKGISDYCHNLAFAIDQLGNAMGAPMMNDLLLKDKLKAPKLYGNVDETISHVTALNFQVNNTTWMGNFVAKSLDKVDKDHIKNAANNEQDNTQDIKHK